MRKIILAILIMIAITFIGLYTNNNLKNKIILKNESSSNILTTNALTMMYETEIDSGEYQVSNGVSWSTDEYKFNEELSKASEETKNKYANFEVENRRIDTEITEFYLSNINTYGFFLPSPNKRLDFSRSIYFVYDNILYAFFTNKPLQAEEVVELLKTF